MPSVYLETTIPSYLAARPSRDLITAAHQQITHAWWEHAADRFRETRFASLRLRSSIWYGLSGDLASYPGDDE